MAKKMKKIISSNSLMKNGNKEKPVVDLTQIQTEKSLLSLSYSDQIVYNDEKEKDDNAMIRRDFKPTNIDFKDHGISEPSPIWKLCDLLHMQKYCQDSELDEYGLLLSESLQILEHSPTAMSLIRYFENKGGLFLTFEDSDQACYYDGDESLIVLSNRSMDSHTLYNSTWFRTALLADLVRSLREAWHADVNPNIFRDFQPVDALYLNRAFTADIEGILALSFWELRTVGRSDPWRHLVGSKDSDIALTFARIVENNKSALYDGTGLQHAFRQWYSDHTRIDNVDHDTLEAIDFELSIADTNNPFGHEKLDAARLNNMTSLPDGLCWMEDLSEIIMVDPYYAGMHDIVNQAHLTHIITDINSFQAGPVRFHDKELAQLIFPEFA